MSATVAHTWRVLLWPLPRAQCKEHILHAFVESLRAHRALGMPGERWRTQVTSGSAHHLDRARLLHSAGGKMTSSGRQTVMVILC